MNSMTGFGRASGRDRRFDIDVEARSVNHRFLSVKVGLPEGLSRYEAEVDRLARARMARGSINVAVTVKRLGAEPLPQPDPRRIKEHYRRLEAIRKKLGIDSPVSFEALLSVPYLWTSPDQKSDDSDKAWTAVARLVEKALDDLLKARAREGAGIRRDILARLDGITAAAARIRELAPRVLETYQRKLDERIGTLLGARGLEIGKADLMKEIAVYADKCDISEELQRLAAHVESFREIVKEGGTVGRRLDFLTQEMVRETNTLASKGSDAGISEAAVRIKAELEKIKEQAENVE
jgi:uncharacterized protein (TIGR00255 family)